MKWFLPKLKRALILEFSTVRALLTSLCTITVVGLVTGGLNPKVFGLVAVFAVVLVGMFIFARRRRTHLTQELFHCAMHRKADGVRRCLLKGADPNAIYPGYQKNADTPLIVACQSQESEIVRLLIDAGANVNVPWSCTTTPLMVAAAGGKVKLMRFLISKGADPNGINKDAYRPLDAAVVEGQEEAAELLRQHGATHSDAYLRIQDAPRISKTQFDENRRRLIRTIGDAVDFLRGTGDSGAVHWGNLLAEVQERLIREENVEETLTYLDSMFGGMGSLNDFGFYEMPGEETRTKEESAELNRMLNTHLSAVYRDLVTVDVPREYHASYIGAMERELPEGFEAKDVNAFQKTKRWRLPDELLERPDRDLGRDPFSHP